MHKRYVFLGVGLVLVVIVILAYYANQSRMNDEPAALSLRFVNTEEGFSFDYPRFEQSTVSTTENEIIYSSLHKNGSGDQQILGGVRIGESRPVMLNPDPSNHVAPSLAARSDTKNPHGVFYSITDSVIIFYLPIDGTTYSALPIGIRPSEKNGFSGSEVGATILNSFRAEE